jgi:hypothetical protein
VTRRQLLLAVALLCYLVAVFAARPAATPGPFVRDFEAYWSAGRAQSQYGNPYGRDVWQFEQTVPGVVAARDEFLPYVGPPHALWLWRAFAVFDYTAAARIWWTVLAIAVAALAITALIGAGLKPRVPPSIAALVFAFSFAPISSGLALGQVTTLAMLGACCAAIWSRATRTFNAVVAAFVASLQPNVALGLVSLLRRPIGAAALALAAIATYVAGACARGWTWPLDYAGMLSEHARAERFAAIQVAPSAIAYAAGLPPGYAIACGALITLVALSAAVVAFFTLRDVYVRFACLSALIPFVAGFMHEHDLIVAFPAAMLAAGRARGAVRAITGIGTLLVAIDWLGMAQRPTGVAQSALLAVAVWCMFAAFGPAEPGDYVAACVVALVFAASAWVAVTHPLPVWPDALGAFHASQNASPAAVWRSELARNGLLAVTPATAWLRSLSLAGCALLAAGIWWQWRLVVDVHEVIERRPRVGLEPG